MSAAIALERALRAAKSEADEVDEVLNRILSSDE
jgi:hypothetical protein